MRKIHTKVRSVDWTLEDGGLIRYRVATSLDKDVATAMSADWAKAVLQGEALLDDFGLIEVNHAQMIEMLASKVEDFKAYAEHFFAVAIGIRCIQKFEDLADENGLPLMVNRKHVAALLADPLIQSEWLSRVLAPLHAIDREAEAVRKFVAHEYGPQGEICRACKVQEEDCATTGIRLDKSPCPGVGLKPTGAAALLVIKTIETQGLWKTDNLVITGLDIEAALKAADDVDADIGRPRLRELFGAAETGRILAQQALQARDAEKES